MAARPIVRIPKHSGNDREGDRGLPAAFVLEEKSPRGLLPGVASPRSRYRRKSSRFRRACGTRGEPIRRIPGGCSRRREKAALPGRERAAGDVSRARFVLGPGRPMRRMRDGRLPRRASGKRARYSEAGAERFQPPRRSAPKLANFCC